MKLNSHDCADLVPIVGAIVLTCAIVTGVHVAMGEPLAEDVIVAAPERRADARSSPPPELAAIPGWQLFGRSEPAERPAATASPGAATQVDEATLPDARVSVNLVGIVASGVAGEARAIISDAGGDHLEYAIGDTIPGGVVIDAIRRKAVLISRQGHRESMRLPEYDRGATLPRGRAAAGSPDG